MTARILVVEDHDNLRMSLKTCLENEGFLADTAENMKDARTKILSGPDLVILDWMLPDGRGVDLLADMGRQAKKIPVIFLTARADLVDKVLGLELGASDYMTKPFEPRELLARIRVRLRERSSSGAPTTAGSVLEVGPLRIDRVCRKVVFRDMNVDLVKKEFDLLALLAESPEKVFSRDEILNKVWGFEVFPTTRTVDTHIMLLRQKFDERLIETVRSVGYRLKRL